MQMSNYAMDRFVAQHLSELGPCSLPSIAEEFPQQAFWISNFVLSRVFQQHVSDEMAPLAFALLGRAKAAAMNGSSHAKPSPTSHA